jgi:WXG100 family type VII secretion target
MATAATNAYTIAEGLTSRLTSVVAQLDGTIWQGSSRRSFDDVKEVFAAEIRNLNGALMYLGNALGGSGTTYVDTDATGATGLTNASEGAGGGTISTSLRTTE